jgi:hypothetical protein
VAIRRSQQKERARLQQDITQSQQAITGLNEQRAPIAAEVRKVEAEVGPIKYIAAFVYGDTDQTILEKAVTWVIIILIVVFDPLAVILLLSSQISFQNFREREKESTEGDRTLGPVDVVGGQPTVTELSEGDSPLGPVVDVVSPEPTVTQSEDPHPVGWMFNEIPVPYPRTEEEVEEVIDALFQGRERSILEQHPYLNKKFEHFENLKPMVMQVEKTEEPVVEDTYLDEPLFVQNEEQKESGLWSSTTETITKEEYQEAAAVNLDPHNDAPHPDVAEYIELVKSRRIALTDVPEEFILAVKARI